MTLRQLLTLALDPSRLLRAAGLTPDPWQQKLLLSNHRHILLNCSRQSGKSTTVAVLALHTALFRPNSLVLLLSPSLRQSGELFRKVIHFYNALRRPLLSLADSQTQLEIANHSRIVSLPGREQTIRSFSGVNLLVIDEAARVSDDLYRSVRPMLAVSRGRLLCLSTPFGKRGFFHQEWDNADSTWQRIRIPWQDCPRITPDFIAQEKNSMGESWIRQEYECSFEAREGLVFPDFEQRCCYEGTREEGREASQDEAADREQETCDESLLAPRPSSLAPRVGGMDFGFRNPFAALWGHVDHDGVLWITGERYVRETSIYDHAAALPKNVTWYADPAGASDIASLRKLGVVVRRGHNDIAAGIAAIHARLETARLKVLRSACPNLLAEAKLYRYPTQQDGQAESEIPVDADNHALAALRYLVSRLDDSVFRKLQRKPTMAQRLTAHLDMLGISRECS